MKTRHVILPLLSLIAAYILPACSSSGNDTECIQRQRDSIAEAFRQQQAEYARLNGYLDVISNGLDSILIGEGILFPEDGDMNKVSRAEMMRNIELYEQLLERQRQRIAALEDSLTSRGDNLGRLTQIVNFLNRRLDEQEMQISGMRAELAGKNHNIRQLTSRVNSLTADVSSLTGKLDTANQINAMQQEALKVQDVVINDCFVRIGTKDELKDAGLIATGFLKKTQLLATNFTPSKFTRVDIRQFTQVTLDSQKPKILTSMPADSYRLYRRGNSSVLEITDPTRFWSVSNYLVIQL